MAQPGKIYNKKTKRYIADTAANRKRIGLRKKSSRKASNCVTRGGSKKCAGSKVCDPSTKRCRAPIKRGRPSKTVRKVGGSKTKDSYGGVKSNPLTKFFNKIYIINLTDQQKRFNKVTKQFVKHGIKYTRFPAIDGRCDKNIPAECRKKRLELAKKYGVKISPKLNNAAASLVIGTREILRDAIKNKYKTILICEDDIVFGRNLEKNFAQGIKELNKNVPNWDLLYLGSGGTSGFRGISEKRTAHNKYKTSLSIVDKNEYNWYVHHKDDLRIPCDEEVCERISDHLTYPDRVGGSWCYAFSLKGARKIFKRLSNINNHVDQIIPDMSNKGQLVTVAFDPPIVWHEGGAFRADSTIPWEW